MLSDSDFAEWADEFFPDMQESPYDRLLGPVAVDPESAGGAEMHYVGLNLSKAWCLAALSETLDSPDSEVVADSAARHARTGSRRLSCTR